MSAATVQRRPYTQMHWPAWIKGILADPRKVDIVSRLDPKVLSVGQLTQASWVGMAATLHAGKGLNLYLPSAKFADWLAGCAPALDAGFLYLLRETLGPRGDVLAVHFPCESGRHSFCCVVVGADPHPDRLIVIQSKEEEKKASGMFALSGTERVDLIEPAGVAPVSPAFGTPDLDEANRIAKLVMGLVMYMSAFPETVRPGVPEDVKHPAHHKHGASAATLEVHEKVCLGGTHASPEPHYRVGHFRVLTSEYFKAARYKSVFVAGTFVKGRASTVEAPEGGAP
jgi:hypothetical protein